jgi:hypothetical protein
MNKKQKLSSVAHAHRVTSMADINIDAIRKQKKQNTLNNTDLNVSCYCNSKLPKTYT